MEDWEVWAEDMQRDAMEYMDSQVEDTENDDDW